MRSSLLELGVSDLPLPNVAAWEDELEDRLLVDETFGDALGDDDVRSFTSAP